MHAGVLALHAGLLPLPDLAGLVAPLRNLQYTSPLPWCEKALHKHSCTPTCCLIRTIPPHALRAPDSYGLFPPPLGLAFGGGPYRCPGRFFAEQELALLLQLLLAAYPHMQLSYATDVQSPATQQHAVQEELKQGEGQQREGEGKQQGTPGAGSGRRQRRASVLARAAAAAAPPVPPQPQLTEVSGGSFLYGLLCWVAGREGLAWGCGWFDGLDGRMEVRAALAEEGMVGGRLVGGGRWGSVGSLVGGFAA